MRKWEYKIDSYEGSIPWNDSDVPKRREAISQWMNAHGLEGWEAISVTNGIIVNTEWMACVWKREIE